MEEEERQNKRWGGRKRKRKKENDMGSSRPEQKQLSQESAVEVRWLLVLSVCLLAVNHCESTTAALFQ